MTPAAASPTSQRAAPPQAGSRAPEPASGLALSPTGLVIIGMLGVAFVGLFYYFFYVQNFQAMTSDDWSHSYFVPFIAGYLLWNRRAELTALKPMVFWPGLMLIVLGIMCYALFQLNQALNNHMLRGFSMLICLFGMILLLLGPRVARAMILPVGYLVFGIALAERIMREITVPLRVIATEGSFALLTAIGVGAERRGTVLEIQTSTGIVPLNIADACAGMRMLIAFVALGAAVALIGGKRWWQRIILLMMALPVALLMNIVRVAVLGLLTLVNPKLAVGESHMLVGYLLLVPAFLLYMALVWALDRIIIEPPEPKPVPRPWWRPGPVRWAAVCAPAVLVCMGLLSASALGLPATIKALGLQLRKLPINAEGDLKVSAIPSETASWKRIGDDQIDSKEAVDELGTQNYLTRHYAPKQPGKGREGLLSLHIAYYTGGIDAVPHIPERCMVAGGWEIAESGTKVLPLALDRSGWRPHEEKSAADAGFLQARLPNQFSAAPGMSVTLPREADKVTMRITEFVDPKTGKKLFGGYFFIANDSVVSSAEDVRLKAFDFRNDYAFYCKVQVTSGDVTSAESLAQMASSLMSELLPEIMRCVPDWSKVESGAYPADNPRRVRASKN